MARNLSKLTRVSSLAIAAALTASASAQSFLGNPNVTFGSVNITEGAGTTDFDVLSTTAVIDWTPDDNAVGNLGAIAFQQSGTTATYSSGTDFAVLNRINVADASRLVSLDGTINSLVNGQTGGSIFFYSPSGFVIGANAAINVGSLLLSASPIAVDGNGNFINGTTVTFDQAPNSSALINTVAGSQINASGSGSYVALVAPTITHHGTIRTDTAAALVAAEAATINFSPDGLFDIQVTVGTDDPNGVNVDGGIITRNSATEGSDHHAYLVAVAKNDAVTMLINNGGSIGFDTATSATVEDNVVVLSGGYEVAGGSPLFATNQIPVNLSVDQASFSTDVIANVTGGATITTSTGDTSFDGNLELAAGDDSFIQAINGNTLSIAGNLTADVSIGGADITGNFLRLAAYGASDLTVGGNVSLTADAFGAPAQADGQNGGNATGGTVIVQTGNDSSLTITGDLGMSANGYGGTTFADASGGNGTGGTVQIQANGGNSSISVGGTTRVEAEGQGGSTTECTVCNITGGTGTGGQINVGSSIGINTLDFAGDISLSAAGFGGSGDAGGGTGTGGQALLVAGDGGTTSVLGDTEVDASGFGGYSQTAVGGTGTGGVAMVVTNGTAGSLIDLAGDVFVTADGTGGEAGDFGGTLAQGGTGTGGRAQVLAILGDIHARNNLTVSAQSIGGAIIFGSGNGGDGLAELNGPAQTWASLAANAGTLTVDGLSTVTADATGADGLNGGSGGDAIGGRATVHAANSDNGTSTIQLGDVVATADATGGNGGDGQGGTNGGDGGNGGSTTAGSVVVSAAAGNGDLTTGAVVASASATGGNGGSGGNGDGGFGGNGGDGGSAMGGFINVGTESGVNQALAINEGIATFTTISAQANATGGNGGDGGFGLPNGDGGDGGSAIGGTSVLLVRGSTVNVGAVDLIANAAGGNGGIGTITGTGGDAESDEVAVIVTARAGNTAQRGTLNAGAITGTVTSTGGTGSTAGTSMMEGGTGFIVENGDATIASLNFDVVADSQILDLATDMIEIINGDVQLTGDFSFNTDGVASVYADNGSLTATNFAVAADNFVHDPDRAFPALIGSISADAIDLVTGQDLIIDAQLDSVASLSLVAPGAIDIEDASTGSDLTLSAGGSISGGAMTAAGLIQADTGSFIQLGTIDATDFVDLDGLAGVTAGDIAAGAYIYAESDGNITLGDLTAGLDVNIENGGNIIFGDASAGTEFDFESDGSVTGGDIVAGASIGGEAGGSVTLGDLTAGFDPGDFVDDDTFSVGIQAVGAIDVGNVQGANRVGFATFGDLTTGSIQAGWDVFAFSDGDIVTGAITSDAGDQVYMSGTDVFLAAGGGEDSDFVPDVALAMDPVATGGSIAIGGPVSTGTFRASAGTDLTTGAIAADQIEAWAGGLSTINGIWSSPLVELWSNDIDIGANGGIDGGTGGLIRLVSTNATQALIGDGLTGTGYALSNAEFGRLSAGNVQILGRGDASAAIDMLIGDLSVTGPSAGSTIEDPLGALVFATGDPETEVPGGVIRIIGDLVATGFADTNAIEFYTGRFELDAATGLFEITSNGTDLSGQLYIEADRIHVASGAILDQLAVDPHYAGYQDDLNAPADVQRPDGVIRVGSIDIFPTEAVLVQNTGTAATPAGFLTFADAPLFSDSEAPAGPIELIINGQLITETGTLTGIDVRDFLIDDANIDIFTDNSMINGCLLAGDCLPVEPPEPPIPSGFQPSPGIQKEIALITDNLLPPPEFGNEDFIDDNNEETEEGATSPIEPPQPLFDTSALGGKSDVDDPVSGSGNPALMETIPPSPNQEQQQ